MTYSGLVYKKKKKKAKKKKASKAQAVFTPQAPSVPTVKVPGLTQPAPGAQATTPLMPDPTYDASVAQLTQQKDLTLAQLAAQKQQAYLNYGYTPGANGALQFDPSNVFSQAAILHRNAQQAHQGNTTGMAAQGQLYSGALQNAQTETDFKALQGEDRLQKGLGAFIANNTAQQAGALVNWQGGLGQAKAQSVADAASNPLYYAFIQAQLAKKKTGVA